MTSQELLDHGRDVAARLLEKNGALTSMIYVHHVNGDFVAVPYKTGNAPVNIEQAIVTRLIRKMRDSRIFGGAAMIAEAWTSTYPKQQEAVGRALRPSLDPDRKEIVLVTVMAHDGTLRMDMYEIDRSGTFPRLGKSIGIGHTGIESWLTDAFQKQEAA